MSVLTLPVVTPAPAPAPAPAPVPTPRGTATSSVQARRRRVRRRLWTCEAPGPTLRLTLRGRVALVALVAVSGAGASLLFGGPQAPPPAAPVGQVVVQPGQTLWSIAGDLAPSADRRDVVAALVAANGLHTVGALQPGQELVVPALP